MPKTEQAGGLDGAKGYQREGEGGEEENEATSNCWNTPECVPRTDCSLNVVLSEARWSLAWER